MQLFTVYLILLLVFLSYYLSEGNILDRIYEPGAILHQIEQANKAANRGGTIIGVKTDRFTIILSYAPITSKFELPVSKIKKLSRSVGVTYSGIYSDGQYLIKKLHEIQRDHEYVYGSSVPASRLARECSELVHVQTRVSALRPYGVRVCLFSYDNDQHSPCLYEIDPSGNLHDCQTLCFGPYSDSFLKTFYDRNPRFEEGLSTVLNDIVESLKQCIVDAEDDLKGFLDENSFEIHVSDHKEADSETARDILRKILGIQSVNTPKS